MAKRFTDTTKWDDDWFLKLKPRLKCAWSWLCDTCDGVGFKKVSFSKMTAEIGEEVTREEFDEHFGSRIMWLSEDTLWIFGFIKAQHKTLSPKNRAQVNMAKLVLRTIHGIPVPEKASTLVDCLSELSRASDESLPSLARESDEAQTSFIGNRKQEIGNRKQEKEEEGTGETRTSQTSNLGADIASVEEVFRETLRFFKQGRTLLDTERMAIGRAIQAHGVKAVEFALCGARHEPKSEKFNPADWVDLNRYLDPKNFKRFLGYGVKAAQKGEGREQAAAYKAIMSGSGETNGNHGN